jgi:hypothetical protein
VIDLKNRFEKPVGGYYDILALVQIAGQPVEVQIHLAHLFLAKEFGRGHNVYETSRELPNLDSSGPNGKDEQVENLALLLKVESADIYGEAIDFALHERLQSSSNSSWPIPTASLSAINDTRRPSLESNANTPPEGRIASGSPSQSAYSVPGGKSSEGIFTVKDTTASSEYQAKPLSMAQKTQDAGPDLFSFDFTNPTTQKAPATATPPDLGFSSLLTPAQQQAKLQQAQQLDLFGDSNDARPRPTSQRPAKPAGPPRAQDAPETTPSVDDLFGQTGLAPSARPPHTPTPLHV